MTFPDNIRAIHNFYCINTNNLIEYSIFVENAQTMQTTFLVPLLVKESVPERARTLIVVWYVWLRKQTMPVITVSVTLCCWGASVVLIHSHIWIFITRQLWWNMRRQPARSAKTSCFIAISAVFLRKTLLG